MSDIRIHGIDCSTASDHVDIRVGDTRIDIDQRGTPDITVEDGVRVVRVQLDAGDSIADVDVLAPDD